MFDRLKNVYQLDEDQLSQLDGLFTIVQIQELAESLNDENLIYFDKGNVRARYSHKEVAIADYIYSSLIGRDVEIVE